MDREALREIETLLSAAQTGSRRSGSYVGEALTRVRALLAESQETEPYSGDEPLGTCVIHGDYWTDDCLRCDRA